MTKNLTWHMSMPTKENDMAKQRNHKGKLSHARAIKVANAWKGKKAIRKNGRWLSVEEESKDGGI